jgi:hypothetical protein
MDGYHHFYIPIQIVEKLQGKFIEETMGITFALGAKIAIVAKASQKSHTNFLKSNSLMCFIFYDHFVAQFIERAFSGVVKKNSMI